MNYTANYRLPQWVESDRILMEDFNDMCANIDTGLQNAKKAAESAQSAADDGIARANAAQATADRNCMVKLAEGNVTSATSKINIDLSGVDLSKYHRLILEIYALSSNNNGTSVLTMRVNNISTESYHSLYNNSISTQMVVSGQGRYIRSKIEICDLAGMVGLRYESMSNVDGNTVHSTTSSSGTRLCSKDGISSIQLLADTQVHNYLPGSWYKLYGVLA